MDHRRKVKRRYLLAEVKIKPDSKGAWIRAVLMNISKGGIGLYSAEPLKARDRAAVKIKYLERGRLKEVEEIPGTIRWVHAIGKHYAAGIMFEEKVNKENYPILTRCLEYAKSK